MLRHQLTNQRATSLHEVVESAEDSLQLSATVESTGDRATAAVERASDLIDKRCLDLCISSIDHDLKGDLFESVVIGFLAVLGIDTRKGILKEAYHYTPSLSGSIKIAQMLVIQKAVITARDNDAAQVADVLDEMRTRFMVQDTQLPFTWANRLRAFGKKVRDLTTCLGYISWSDDELSLSRASVSRFSRNIQ
jgi:hypothetical protein